MRREHETMLRMRDLVHPRDTVFDVGGHIGYVALWLAYLASEGECHVFEPSPENLSYLLANTQWRENVRVVDKGLGESPGMFTLYLDNTGGQNTSFVSGYQGWRRTHESLGIRNMDRRTVEVEVITLDCYVNEIDTIPTFIKIDVEGSEVDVLNRRR
jgi:FkbM family methyltransferase